MRERHETYSGQSGRKGTHHRVRTRRRDATIWPRDGRSGSAPQAPFGTCRDGHKQMRRQHGHSGRIHIHRQGSGTRIPRTTCPEPGTLRGKLDSRVGNARSQRRRRRRHQASGTTRRPRPRLPALTGALLYRCTGRPRNSPRNHAANRPISVGDGLPGRYIPGRLP